MATDIFIKLDGIDGEATHKDHKGEIDVVSWHWGLSASTGSGGGGGGASSGKAVAQDFRFVHHYDTASPLLVKTAASGKRLKTAVLTARKVGEGQKGFFKVTLKDVAITSIADSGDGTGTSEEVAMVYGEIDFSYKPQDGKGGLGAEAKVDWNVKTGKVTNLRTGARRHARRGFAGSAGRAREASAAGLREELRSPHHPPARQRVAARRAGRALSGRRAASTLSASRPPATDRVARDRS